MIEIKIKISNKKARMLHYYLRNLYNKRKNISLERLCLIAIWKEMYIQAVEEKLKALEYLEEEKEEE